MQELITYTIIICAGLYVLYKLMNTIISKNNQCGTGGCNGCGLNTKCQKNNTDSC